MRNLRAFSQVIVGDTPFTTRNRAPGELHVSRPEESYCDGASDLACEDGAEDVLVSIFGPFEDASYAPCVLHTNVVELAGLEGEEFLGRHGAGIP